MGYYASYCGNIKTRRLTDREVIELLERFDLEPPCSVLDIVDEWAFQVSETQEELDDGRRSYFFYVDGYDKFHDDDIYDTLERITPFTEEGEIEYVGEDYVHWRYAFRDGCWYEDNAKIVYVDNEFPITNYYGERNES